ncbi:MAG: sugar phosphate isomerase/epimerase [Victivallales bacterium]|nr:sugar phosphate isomerase/epimerase [Victivallales bacterium]
MLKSISYWSFPQVNGAPMDPIQAMRLAKENGYDAIELCFGLTGPLTPTTDQQTCQRWADEASRIGIQLQSVASGMTWECSPTDLNAATRAQAVANLKGALDRAAWIGAKSLLHVPGAVNILWEPKYGPVPYDKAVEWARESVKVIGEHAAQIGVELCLENVWNGMFYSPLEFRDFVDSFDNPFVGIYFDAGNVLGYHQYPPHWIELLGKRIRRVHIKDFKKDVGSLAGFCDLLAGDMPWKETMAALRKIGYDKTITAEMMPPDDTLLARTSQALDKILAM